MTTSTWGKITDEEMARVAKRFGTWRRAEPYNRDCTYDNFEHYARGVGNVNPLFQDEEYAAKSRWGVMIAHPLYVHSLFRKAGVPGAGGGGFPGVHGTDASFLRIFYRPMKLGDRLAPKRAQWDHYLVPSRFAGRRLDTLRREAVVDQNTLTLVTEAWDMLVRWEREAARERRDTTGPYVGWKRHVYTDEELQMLWEDFERTEIRGATPRHWEDVNVGDKVGPLVTMPYTAREIITYYMGAGAPMMMSNQVFYNYFKRHPGVNVPDPETHTPDVPERTHYDRDFGRYAGFPDMYDVIGPRCAYGVNMITNWMGDDAFLREISMQGRRPLAYGDVCWINGQVTEKYRQGSENLVKIVMAYDTQKWRVSFGHALVSLPSRERGPVVLSEAPPDPETQPYDREKPTPDYVKSILYQKEPDLPYAARFRTE